MNVTSKLLRSSAAALAALVLVAGPVAAAEEAPAEPGEEATEEHAEEEGGKLQIAETPHQQLGLLFLGALGLGGALAFANARRQLKGERPQATGEFRWR